MSCWMRTFIATSLVTLSTHQLWSWGSPRVETRVEGVNSTQPSIAENAFPLNNAQQWYTKESYLLWSPHEDDIDWAARFTENLSSEITMKTHLKKPHFGWYSGARLTVGRYLPKHDHWDISLTTTYFYANKRSESSPNFDRGGSLISLWSPLVPFFNYSHGTANWRLNFFTWDLTLGRNIDLSSKITAHPFAALRSYLIYEKQAAKYSGSQYLENQVMANVQQNATLRFRGDALLRFKGYNDNWGVGPRIGSDFTYFINQFWTLIGSLSGSVLLGSYKVGENINSRYNGNDSLIFNPNFVYSVSDHGYDIRTNLEASIGMGWEKWVQNDRVRIAPSVVFEASEWFDMNQWIVLRDHSAASPTSLNYYSSDRKHGDLTFFGFTFNLQVDF